MVSPGFFPRASKSPGSVQGQFPPSQEGLASFTAVNQDPGAEACRWNVGANFPEPSFQVDLNCQSYYKSRFPGTFWMGSARMGSTTGALPRDFHCLNFCARLECFLCSHSSFQSLRGKMPISGQKLEGRSEDAHQGQKCMSCYNTFPSLPFVPVSILRTSASGQGTHELAFQTSVS